MVQIDNYAPHTLSGGKHKVESGLTSRLPTLIGPGVRDAVALYQNQPLKGVEAILSYVLAGSYRIFILFNVTQLVAGREPNQVGVCIARSPDVWNDDWYDSVILGAISCLWIDENAQRNPQTRQSCHDDYCVQASITSSHQANLAALILPRKFEDLAMNLSGNPDHLNQRDLDNILNVPESCGQPEDAVPSAENRGNPGGAGGGCNPGGSGGGGNPGGSGGGGNSAGSGGGGNSGGSGGGCNPGGSGGGRNPGRSRRVSAATSHHVSLILLLIPLLLAL